VRQQRGAAGAIAKTFVERWIQVQGFVSQVGTIQAPILHRFESGSDRRHIVRCPDPQTAEKMMPSSMKCVLEP